MAKITVRLNGPLMVEGDDVTIVDWTGAAYRAERTPVALCRCGQSGKRPFCDGAHNRCGFAAAEGAAAPVA